MSKSIFVEESNFLFAPLNFVIIETFSNLNKVRFIHPASMLIKASLGEICSLNYYTQLFSVHLGKEDMKNGKLLRKEEK